MCFLRHRTDLQCTLEGKECAGIYQDIKYLKDQFGGSAIEFHDNNFLFQRNAR